MNQQPATEQPELTDIKSCTLTTMQTIYIIANILVCGFGVFLLYQNWERLHEDPVLGFLAVIFLYLFTRDLSLR